MNFKQNKKSKERLSWYARFRRYADLCVTSGFVPKRVDWLQKLGKLIGRFWTFIQIGKVTVVGEEHAKFDGYTLYCPNHSSLLDAIVLVPLLPENMHFMSAVEEMRGFFGIKAVLMGSMGCFPVDRSRGKTVIPAAIGVVADGNNLTIFPEGKISPSGQYLVFKKGPAWISIGAFEELDRSKPIRIVPVHICYGTRHEDSALDFKKMFFHWRQGATVTFGEPIDLRDFEVLDADKLTEEIRFDVTSVTCDTTSV